ncbi:hypothetical protein PSEUBRA_001002 [Kalmanozyma brasiliensis GHG001]|uniref:uncharacterized protein n=1 Tax=Kalmanozyma brasiliensis (strain GHG001) TaxID=1365824 RepID=UPI001CE79A69|nr:uncharacterized protein PSEUBRA_001002 [Kalmanozyma brasiliensis GHG001]EST09404.2 hypothetical protein PSEUBRA_001002 [Kalmanozyma brasiliensis GHG001]
MSSFRNLDVQLAQCEGLQQAIQVELANREYSSEDDPVMAEYIVVMLANQKTAEQITAEMKELIGDEYDGAFTEWIWKATRSFLEQHGAATDAAEGSTSAAAVASGSISNTGAAEDSARTRNARLRRSRSPQASGSASRARDNRRSRSPAQLNARRGDQRRSRSRSPPAPASQRRDHRMSRDYSSNEAWKNSSSTRRDEQTAFDGAAYWRNKAEERRRNPPPRVGAPPGERAFQSAYDQAVRNSLADTAPNGNAGRELFPTPNRNDDPEPPTYEQTGGISIFGRAGIPDPRAAEFVPSFAAVQPAAEPSIVAPEAAANGQSSIFSRIDPMLPDNQPPPAAAPESTHSSDFPTAPTETSICRWNLGCTNPMCPYSHASPSAAGPNGDPNALVLSQQNCRYGAGCTNKDCTRSHVSPAVARIRPRAAAPVSFAPAVAPAPVARQTLSMDTALPSQSTSRPCRFGAACTRGDCFFSHPPSRSGPSSGVASSTPCRFGLGCTRADCYFSHPPGQRAIAQGGTVNRLAVFAQSDEQMEIIIPGSAEREGSTPGITT